MKNVSAMLMLFAVSMAVRADFTETPHIAGNFNNWDAGAIMMTETAPGSGVWRHTITGLAPGEYQQFKITQGDWDSNWPEQNSWYAADANGEVTVTFNANNVSDGWWPSQYRLQVNTDPGTWSLVGDFNGWNNADPTCVMTPVKPGSGVYAITRTFAAGLYNLKPTKTGSWDAIGPTKGRCIDADNYVLALLQASEVTICVNAYNGTMTVGEDVDLSFLYQPYDPYPADAAVVGTSSVTALSWTNPDPNYPEDVITCDVYFLDAGLTKLTNDPNMGPIIADPGVVQIADDITAETFNLNDALVPVLPLQEDHYYYWAVHAADPHGNSSGAVTTPGKAWYFFTGDSKPVAGKPADQYMWLAQDDSAIGGFGDTNPNVRYFQVTASYTDDGKSPVVDANMVNLNWGWDPANGQRGVEMVSQTWIPGPGTHTSGTVTAVYKTHYAEGDPDNSTTLPGYWQIRLDVTDGTGTTHSVAGIHRVFATCGQAAAADPADPYEVYYDTNSDCIVNLQDFAEFAEAWLTQSTKYE